MEINDASRGLFTEFNMLPSLQASLTEKNLNVPTEIQAKTIPVLLGGGSVIGVAETGSGKTLAYALPILHLLKTLENKGQSVSADRRPRGLVMVPTRELGEQVSRVFKPFTHTTRLRVRTILGGTAFEVSRKNVSGPFEILVATPGRLVQMLDRKLLSLSDVRFLVFDEADQMLDQGFLEDATRIAGECLKESQLALFSATVSPAVQELMNKLFAGVEIFKTVGSHRVVPTLTTTNRQIIDGKRLPILASLLAKPVEGGTLIFTNTRDQCDKLATGLAKLGHKCLIYRGEMNKNERRSNLKAFREARVEFLISTDLASRGLDVEHVGRVINYHMPSQMDNYLHRVGRTARAGRKGLVINFVTERDKAFVQTLASVKSLASLGK